MIIEKITHLPNRWTDSFMKANVTPVIKRDYKVTSAKCVKLERLPDRSQKLTYELTA